MGQPEVNAKDVEIAPRPPDVAPRRPSRWTIRRARALWGMLTVALGFVLPAYLLVSAHQAILSLDVTVTSATDLGQVAASLPEPIRQFKSGNDYSLLFSTYVEQGIQRTVLNRLRMKAAVMQVGLAISCVGLLFLLFGVDGGGLEAGASAGDKTAINIKIATSGAMIFVLGALLAAGGGLMPSSHSGGSAEFWLGPSSAQDVRIDEASADEKTEYLQKILKALSTCDSIGRGTEKSNCKLAALKSAGVGK